MRVSINFSDRKCMNIIHRSIKVYIIIIFDMGTFLINIKLNYLVAFLVFAALYVYVNF